MTIRNARLLARGVLDTHWDRKLPVNAIQIAYKAGLAVEYDTNLSKAHSSGRTVGNTIRVNPLESTMRQRFTIFHEMGHIMLGHGDSFRNESDAYGQETSPEESAANAFAVEMALPVYAIAMLRDAGMTVREIADEFDVSDRVMAMRMQELGYA